MARHCSGGDGSSPLWIAEPYVNLAPEVNNALEARASRGRFGYETRPDVLKDAPWAWMATRHPSSEGGLRTLIGPSVGTSIGVLVEQLIESSEGVILQPPVSGDFKPLVASADGTVVRNPLMMSEGGCGLGLDGLVNKTGDQATRVLILCNPHNPVGRVWTAAELADVAAFCGQHRVFVIADEIRAYLTLARHGFMNRSEKHQGLRKARTSSAKPRCPDDIHPLVVCPGFLGGPRVGEDRRIR